jgi:hypothetical protein
VASYYQYDLQGSKCLLMNAIGTVTDTYAYDAWGNPVVAIGSTVNPYRYIGQKGTLLILQGLWITWAKVKPTTSVPQHEKRARGCLRGDWLFVFSSTAALLAASVDFADIQIPRQSDPRQTKYRAWHREAQRTL